MKTISALYLVAVALAITAFSAEPTAKSLGKCPKGHSTLKDVPIVYGLPPLKGEKVENWQKGIDNLEFVPGGCSSDFDSPQHEVICITCRFAHSVFSTNSPLDGSWTRHSSDAESFPKPISSLVKLFPVPSKEQLKQPVSYTQSLSDSLNVRYDGISYRTSIPVSEIKMQVSRWLSAQNLQCSFTNYTYTNMMDTKFDSLRWQAEKLSANVSIYHEHSDKISSVSATFYR